MSEKFLPLNYIEISKSNFLHNIEVFRALTDRPVIPVLKANAYGHGLREIASIVGAADVPFVAVNAYEESQVVREVCDKPVLVMGALDSENILTLETNNTWYSVSRIDTIEAWGKRGDPVTIHIEIETGMKRNGIDMSELPALLACLKKYPNITVDGVMSHLADADNPETDDFVEEQIKRFDEAVAQVRAAGFSPTWIHLAQSAGSSRVLSKETNAVRPGIALYGLNPLERNDQQFEAIQKTKPVMKVISRIGAVQTLEPGESVSYSRTYTATKKERIGVLPFGYYEGLPRSLSNQAIFFGPNGEQLPIRGRICMNHTMIDITDTDLTIGDPITVISANREDPNSIDSLCQEFNLFNYEFAVNVNEMTERIVVS